MERGDFCRHLSPASAFRDVWLFSAPQGTERPLALLWEGAGGGSLPLATRSCCGCRVQWRPCVWLVEEPPPCSQQGGNLDRFYDPVQEARGAVGVLGGGGVSAVLSSDSLVVSTCLLALLGRGCREPLGKVSCPVELTAVSD